MVRHHVAQRAGLIVIAAAHLDAQRFGHRDLHMVDVTTIPDRLEDAVAEAKDQDVLNGFLPEVVINPIDLMLLHDDPESSIELTRRRQIGAERFFDNHPPPTVAFVEQSSPRQPFAHVQKLFGGDREIEEAVPCLDRLRHRIQFVSQPLPCQFVVEIRRDVRQVLHRAIEESRIDRMTFGALDCFAELFLELLHGRFRSGEADDGHPVGQQSHFGEVVQRWDQESVGQVAARAKDDEGAGIGGVHRNHGISSPPKRNSNRGV